MVKTIKGKLKKKIYSIYFREVEVLFVKNLGMDTYGVKFRFIDTGHTKSRKFNLRGD